MTCIYLDLRGSPPPEPWQPQPQPQPQTRGPSTASIMVVEDDETVREVVARMLEDAGYNVVTAGDGVEALDLMGAQFTMDLLITDIRMPRMGGRTLTDHLPTRHPELPVIYISGYVADWQPEMATGPNRAFLRKPFTEGDLLRAIEALLGRRS